MNNKDGGAHDLLFSQNKSHFLRQLSTDYAEIRGKMWKKTGATIFPCYNRFRVILMRVIVGYDCIQMGDLSKKIVSKTVHKPCYIQSN